VLDFAKIESGKLELEAVPFDLGDTLAQLADMFSWRAAEKAWNCWPGPRRTCRCGWSAIRCA
jgi:signal transduction histidine kinase